MSDSWETVEVWCQSELFSTRLGLSFKGNNGYIRTVVSQVFITAIIDGMSD